MTDSNQQPDVRHTEPSQADVPAPIPQQAELARAAVGFCETLREAWRHGFMLPPELANLAALEMLAEHAAPDRAGDESTVAQLAWVFCFNVRRAIKAGLEGYEHLVDLTDEELLVALTRKIRGQAGLPPD